MPAMYRLRGYPEERWFEPILCGSRAQKAGNSSKNVLKSSVRRIVCRQKADESKKCASKCLKSGRHRTFLALLGLMLGILGHLEPDLAESHANRGTNRPSTSTGSFHMPNGLTHVRPAPYSGRYRASSSRVSECTAVPINS